MKIARKVKFGNETVVNGIPIGRITNDLAGKKPSRNYKQLATSKIKSGDGLYVADMLEFLGMYYIIREAKMGNNGKAFYPLKEIIKVFDKRNGKGAVVKISYVPMKSGKMTKVVEGFAPDPKLELDFPVSRDFEKKFERIKPLIRITAIKRIVKG